MSSFVLKNLYIQLVRFIRDEANTNIKWTLKALIFFPMSVFFFTWLVGRYQDIIFFDREPATFRSIPLLLACFFGHTVYNSPFLRKSIYAKSIVQTLLNAISILALGQLLIAFIGSRFGIVITFIMLTIVIFLTIKYSKHSSLKNTMFTRLHSIVEESQSKASRGLLPFFRKKEEFNSKAIYSAEHKRNINKKGSLKHLRYYSEECNLELFWSVPTTNSESQLQVLGKEDRAQHSQIIAGTGAGKTLFASNLVVQDLFNDAIGCTVIEPKGSFIRRLSNLLDRSGRKYYRLDPDVDNPDCLNPLYVTEGGDIELMIEANISAFHAHLGPEAKQFFKSRSTQLLRVCIKALKLAYGNECGFDELNEVIQPFGEKKRTDTLFRLQQKNLLHHVQLLSDYHKNLGTDGKIKEFTIQTYSSLHDYMLELTSNKHIQKMFCGKSTFNIDDVLQKGEIVLFNAAYGKLQTLTYTVGKLYINLMKASTFRREIQDNFRSHSLLIDEIEMFADDEFSTFLEMAREYEVFVTVIHQGNEQLKDVSRRLSAMVKQNAVQKFVLAGLEVEDAEYYAKLFTEKYKHTLSSGTDEMATTGFNTQIREEKRYLVDPSDFLRLKGYNPQTGEPAECYFRGVKNNVRQDPVLAEIYPLPKVLFSPLSDEPEDIMEEEEVNGEIQEELVPQEINQSLPTLDEPIGVAEKLIKEVPKGVPKENLTEVSEPGVPLMEKRKRNPLWDSKREETNPINQLEESIPWESQNENITDPLDIETKIEATASTELKKDGFEKANVGQAALSIADKIREKAREGRDKKKENEAG
ncbi:type IV secretory system conjugative DNA transfer family protein [Paenibacillus peoriae]|uniref:type IV secretory system conjugative DNA transfer family protein n=1 Tax=Paenibacillus peoriae TaxID=59893 RepID=UPI0009BD7695|nr:type IV secretory system conjugative DNA transfer family protein [Paenibacillus peoriae]